MTADIVLWLDLAEANQLQGTAVREAVPHGASILRLTDHGAAPCPAGTPTTPTGWRSVLDAIDRLVREARKLEQQSRGARFWVTGRAGLPAFFHLGHRLSKMSAVTFVHQPRNSATVAVMPLDAPRGAGEGPPCFERTPWPVPQSESHDPVALVVSSVHRPPDSQIEEALAKRMSKPAQIVRAHSPTRFDEQMVAPAMRELDELIQVTCNAHAARTALSVFIAGPSSLAFLVGNAINPRACGDIQIFDFDGKRYSPVYELPYPPVPERNEVLFFTASPTGGPRLKLDEEIRALRLERSPGTVADRLMIEDIPASRRRDVFDALRTRRPGAVHFSGHGTTGALIFQDDHGKPSPLEISDLAEILRLAGNTVHLVVLNACYSTSHAESLLAHVDCVVAMRGPIWDEDAKRFSATFYRHLAEGDPVRDAFDKGLLDMRLDRPAGTAGSPSPGVTPHQPLAPHAHEEPPRLLERYPGCARTLVLVRRR